MSDNATMKNTTIHDMTTGSPARLIMQFMIPMFLGNIFQQFYNIADSIIAGQFLGVRALAAIGSTGSLMFFVTGWLNGLSSGFAILVSQWFGAKEYERMRHYVAMSIYLSAGWAVLMTIGLGIANEPILRLMNYKDSIMPDVKAYMGIIYAGLIVTAAYNALAAFLRALGDSKSPLYFLIISAVINVGLDVAFIIYGGMGVEGCAYATVIAQGISAVLCFIYIVKKFPILHLKKENFRFSLPACGKLMALGVPMALQFSITAIGTMMVQSALNILGSYAVAAFTAGNKIENIFTQAYVAIGTTMATYNAQNIGARKLDRVRQGFNCAHIIGIIYAIVTGVIIFFFGKYLSYLFISDNAVEVIPMVDIYVKCVAVFFIPLHFVNALRNGIQGMGYGLLPMLAGVAELAGRGITAMIAAAHKSYFGACMARPMAWVLAGGLLIIMYFYVMKDMKRRLDL